MSERLALKSGRVVWRYENHAERPGRKFKFIARFAKDGSRLVEERGDQDGWVLYAGDRPISRFPRLRLENERGIYEVLETQPIADFWMAPVDSPTEVRQPPPNGAEFQDIRLLGIHACGVRTFLLGLDCLYRLRGDPNDPRDARARYQEANRNGTAEVTAEWPDGARARWRLLPDKNCFVEHAELVNGGLRLELRCEPSRYSGIWFPAKAEFRVDGELVETYTVVEARFNEPDDPATLTGADIGLEPGYNIVPKNFNPPASARSSSLVWDGEDAIETDAFYARVRAGELEQGPTMRRFRRGESSPYATQEQRQARRMRRLEAALLYDPYAMLTDWDQCVHDLCRGFALDAEQRERAFQILKDCKDQASRYLASHKAKLESSAAALRNARKNGGWAQLQNLQGELKELMAPVEDLFENRLKPRLDTIPTAAQRAAASQPASRPVSAP